MTAAAARRSPTGSAPEIMVKVAEAGIDKPQDSVSQASDEGIGIEPLAGIAARKANLDPCIRCLVGVGPVKMLGPFERAKALHLVSLEENFEPDLGITPAFVAVHAVLERVSDRPCQRQMGYFREHVVLELHIVPALLRRSRRPRTRIGQPFDRGDGGYAGVLQQIDDAIDVERWLGCSQCLELASFPVEFRPKIVWIAVTEQSSGLIRPSMIPGSASAHARLSTRYRGCHLGDRGPICIMLPMIKSAQGSIPERKRHHFVSVTYLNAWVSGPGMKLHAYRSDNPSKPLHVRPDEIAFENYYYSQTRPDGTRDNDSFEALFGGVESNWPAVIAASKAQTLDRSALHWLYAMTTMMRTRVPAARDYNEQIMALETRTSLKVFAEMGKLPDKLKRYENELDTVDIAIERQRTLGKMGDDMRQFGDLTLRIGFELLLNDTGVDFITSDNPVAYFDPDDAGIHHPYINNEKVELYFPLTPTIALHGANRLRRFGQMPRFRSVGGVAKVRAINRTIARFAYGLMFARDRSHDDLIARHAALSPVLDAKVVRKPKAIEYHIGHRFGPRPELLKFRPDQCEGDLYEEDFNA